MLDSAGLCKSMRIVWKSRWKGKSQVMEIRYVTDGRRLVFIHKRRGSGRLKLWLQGRAGLQGRRTVGTYLSHA
jgi:hypothetical protein